MLKRATLLLYTLLLLLFVGCFLDDYKSDDGENTPPSISLNLETTTGFNVGSDISFKARGFDSESPIDYYVWRVDGNDQNGELGEEFTFSFSETGDHVVSVKAVVSSSEETGWSEVSFSVAEKDAPLIKSEISTQFEVAKETLLSVKNIGAGTIKKCYWTIKSDNGDSSVTTDKPELQWTFPKELLNTRVYITVQLENDAKKSEEKKISAIVGSTKYPLHYNIKASCFWAGEGASEANDNISNFGSAWHSKWTLSFGLEDHPTKTKRDGNHIPTSDKFTGEQNPYYFALPYNDFGHIVYDGKGDHISTDQMIDGDKWGKKISSQTACYWTDVSSQESACKNRWIEITVEETTCYAQWEDAGPYYYEDTAYVFGTAEPLCVQEGKNYPNAGIDLSPSVWLYFGKELKSWGYTGYIDSWRFVDYSDVPDGPWKKHVTTNGVNWK